MSAGIADHLVTKASPWISSSTKTKIFTRMMRIVTTGMCTGRRDASLNGIRPPMVSPPLPLTVTPASLTLDSERPLHAISALVDSVNLIVDNVRHADRPHSRRQEFQPLLHPAHRPAG